LERKNGEKGRESSSVLSEQQHGEYSTKVEMSKATTIAACFLLDYEAGRPPSLSPNFRSITNLQLQLYRNQVLASSLEVVWSLSRDFVALCVQHEKQTVEFLTPYVRDRYFSHESLYEKPVL
jgi:hypothetical protein